MHLLSLRSDRGPTGTNWFFGHFRFGVDHPKRIGMARLRCSLWVGYDLLVFLVVGLKLGGADAVIGLAVKAKVA
jgi:hypothetical protein